ncbi:DNA alkylation repair protein [Martelella alba]|uniref:DNA alkylation repair protein n=1 Tax=Martelella alba TaxID=2590451 RepID=A0A506UG70_9HYPH|nr:DNA alkylation repair protein [Martelella alba]TPW30957.1 DNA alkylation repair protein [Martelella alba]
MGVKKPLAALDAAQIEDRLRAMADPAIIAGMARVGIATDDAIGISNPDLRALVKAVGRDHVRAFTLWQSPLREARLLALMTLEPEKLTPEEAFMLAGDFASWEIVDEAADRFVAAGLFPQLVAPLARDGREFVRRAAFAMIASAAVHLKETADTVFMAQLPLIVAYAGDGRNFVKKAVNWALRNIGKRNTACYREALAVAEALSANADPTARWIGRDAVRFLTSDKLIARLKP